VYKKITNNTHKGNGKDNSLSFLTNNIEKISIEKITANGCVSNGVWIIEKYGNKTKTRRIFEKVAIFTI
jgi:hypothetical protein